MSDLKDQLIKLGHSNPELREHIRPVLDRLQDKTASGYSLTDRGLEKPKKILAQPNTVYYFGASSSPQRIVTETVTSDVVTYYVFGPQGKASRMREQRWIWEDLAAKGSQTWLKTYGKYHPEQAASLSNLLDGRPGTEVNLPKFLADQEKIYAVVVPDQEEFARSGRDPWYAAEEYGGVAGFADSDQLEILMNRGELEALQRDPRFNVVNVKTARVQMPQQKAAAQDEIFHSIIPWQGLFDLQDTLAGDEDLDRILSDTILYFKRKFDLNPNEEMAMTRLKGLVNNPRQDPATVRNHLGKIADLLGMKTPLFF
jgi:hypothetical protein